MLNIKKRKKSILISFLLVVLTFSFNSTVMASGGYTTVYMTYDDDTVMSMGHHYESGEEIYFHLKNYESSIHNVTIILYNPNGDAVDYFVLSPGGESGKVYFDNNSLSGEYKVGLGCGGLSQTGCKADAYFEPF